MSTTPPPEHRVAGKLAQLLSEVLISHAPHTAKVNADQTTASVNDWLEGLEAHTQGFVAPFLQHILDNSNPPEPVRALLAEAIEPQAQFSATIEQVFLWGIIGSITGRAVDPFLQGISNELGTAAVAAGIHRPVDLGTIATAAARGLNLGDKPTVTVPDWAYEQAAMLGIDSSEVDLAASIVGLPPALQELFELYRRGLIDTDDVKRGLREGDFRDDWIDNVIGLIHAWLTPGDFVRAAVQAQLPYDVAREWAGKTGLDTATDVPINPGNGQATPDMFGLAFSIAGRPPGPQELGRMALRGIIPWEGTGADALTFQQGVAESDVKTKWTDSLKQLETYVPPPRTVGTLYQHGAITADQAIAYWKAGGVPDALAQGYLFQAQQEHIGQEKLLAKGEITTAYYDGIITQDQAELYLGLLGYHGEIAAQILEIQDFRRQLQAVNKVVSKVGTLYTEFKISATHALASLTAVGIPDAQQTMLLGTWEQLRIAPIRVPTVAEIGLALKAGTITVDQGLADLANLGYQPQDAAVVLSAHSGVLVAPLPAPGTSAQR